MSGFYVVAWNNGHPRASGAGYGLKIAAGDRDVHMRRHCDRIELRLDGVEKSVFVNINKASFWNTTCRELISKDIGHWPITNGLAPWLAGHPPRLLIEALGEGTFDVRLPRRAARV